MLAPDHNPAFCGTRIMIRESER